MQPIPEKRCYIDSSLKWIKKQMPRTTDEQRQLTQEKKKKQLRKSRSTTLGTPTLSTHT